MRLARWRWMMVAGALVLAGGTGAAITLAGDSAEPASSSAGPVAMFPSPGTATASATTEISLRGAAPGDLSGVVVTGSRSGRHRGRIVAHSDGRGGSFVSSHPFKAGERVTVRTGFDIAGVRGRHASFRIATGSERMPPSTKKLTPVRRTQTHRYHSAPKLHPPFLHVYEPARGTAPGLVFVAPKGRGQQGPMIVDESGEPVWFHALHGEQKANDFRLQSYDGKPMLTWWQGLTNGGSGEGHGVIADHSYRVVKTVRGGNGYRLDMHEFRLTGRGTALATIYHRVRRDLRQVGGSRSGLVVDGIFQEIDIETGRVLFEWHSIGHVSYRESDTRAPENPDDEYDYFHINSVERTADGNYLVSARHTSGVYKVDGRTGRVIWRLGGARSDFKLGRGASFALQHDVREQPDGTIRLFDNSDKRGRRRTRVITLKLDTRARTATLVRALDHGKLFAATQGDAQPQPNGDTFVEWGSQGRVSSFDSAGKLIYDAELPDGYDSYRGYRFPWSAHAPGRPDIAVGASGAGMSVWASWNGANDVASWRVLAGPSPDGLQPVATARRDGFETKISVGSSAPSVAVQALGAGGEVLATSAARSPGD